MPTITIYSERLRVSIAPDLGAGIADLSLQGPAKFFYPLMRRAGQDETNPSALGSFFMAPWVNRIGGGKFRFQGREIVLRANGADGTAMHGDVRARPWTLLDRSPQSVRLAFDSRKHKDVNWPWPFVCEARYELAPTGLTLDLSVQNSGDTPMPAGCGHHPYFARRLWREDDVLQLRAVVSGQYPMKASLPTGPAAANDLTVRLATLSNWPDTPLDDVFAGLKGPVELHWSGSRVTLRMIVSENLGHLVLFGPNAEAGKSSALPFVAVEPQSQVNNALHLLDQGDFSQGTAILSPGETLRTSCRFEVEAHG